MHSLTIIVAEVVCGCNVWNSDRIEGESTATTATDGGMGLEEEQESMSGLTLDLKGGVRKKEKP